MLYVVNKAGMRLLCLCSFETSSSGISSCGEEGTSRRMHRLVEDVESACCMSVAVVVLRF